MDTNSLKLAQYSWHVAADIVRSMHSIGTYGTLAVLALLQGERFSETVTVFQRTLRIEVTHYPTRGILMEVMDN